MGTRLAVVASAAALVAALLAGGALAASARSDRGWEVALVHKHTLKGANLVLAEVQKQSQAQGLKAEVERDGRGDYEVSITGFRTQRQAAAARTRARRGFSPASLERT